MLSVGEDDAGGTAGWVWLDRFVDGRLVVEGEAGIEFTSGMFMGDAMFILRK